MKHIELHKLNFRYCSNFPNEENLNSRSFQLFEFRTKKCQNLRLERSLELQCPKSLSFSKNLHSHRRYWKSCNTIIYRHPDVLSCECAIVHAYHSATAQKF